MDQRNSQTEHQSVQNEQSEINKTSDNWKNKLINNFISCDHCSKLVKKTLIFFTNRDNSSFCSNHCKLVWCQKKDLDSYSENYRLSLKRDIDNWLEQNYPQNGVCRIDDYHKNKGKKRSEMTHLAVHQKELIGTLDLSSFTNLEQLYCWGNQLSFIILPTHSLEALECGNNQLISIELNNCLKLVHLNISNNQLTSLNVNHCLKLVHLNVSNNELCSLELNNCLKLEYLNVSNNQLTILNISNCLKLKELNCQNNQLSSLEINHCLDLKELSCFNNQLTSLILSRNNRLIKINAFNNYLTTFNYDSLNPLTLEDLKIHNNNLKATDLAVFTPFVNLTNLHIGNDPNWIRAGNPGNKFTGSFSFFQELTKLQDLNVYNLPLQSDLEYLPSSLQEIISNGQIEKELKLYGQNLLTWQAHHPHLMEKVNKEIVHLTDYLLVTNKQISVDSIWFKGRESQQKPLLRNNQEDFNHSLQFTYSSFLVKDAHPFSWEADKPLETKVSGEYSAPESKLSESSISRERQNNFYLVKENIPTKLYHIPTNTVVWTNNVSNISSYAILSYAWGDLFDQTNRDTWDYDYQDEDGKITAEQLGVYPEFKTTGTTKESVQALKKTLATIKLLNEQHDANIEYLWMDQMCINQFDNREKEREVPKMRQYYSQVTVTLISIDIKVGKVDRSDRGKSVERILEKITHSDWFTRAWTFQEGVLSKQTIFMFDDCLVDGRSLALFWGGGNGTYNSNPCTFITPFGWSVGNQVGKNVDLTLGEALFTVTNRDQTVLLDKVYAILGLLPYGSKVNVEYKNKSTIEDLEKKLAELINQAYLHNPKEILTYLGERNSNHWWLPTINPTGSFQIEESLNYDNKAYQYCLAQVEQVTQQGVQLKGHWIKQTDQQIIELNRFDLKNNALWNLTIQFMLNQKTKVITIKEVWDNFYYSEVKQRPTNLFLDMINFQVIEGEREIKEYLQSLEDESKLSEQIEHLSIGSF